MLHANKTDPGYFRRFLRDDLPGGGAVFNNYAVAVQNLTMYAEACTPNVIPGEMEFKLQFENWSSNFSVWIRHGSGTLKRVLQR